MKADRKILAVIPARGGSKGLPRKNLLPLGDRPLICWTIAAALAAKRITRVIVSTDDREIAAAAAACGCEVPFLRPPELATDTAGSADVMRHAVDSLEEDYDWLMLLQPTSPFRTADHIDGLAALLDGRDSRSAVSVVALDKSPEWMFWMNEQSGQLSPLLGEIVARRRQDSRRAYVLNGAMYLVERDLFLRSSTFVHADTLAYPMSPRESIDIDSRDDLSTANAMLDAGQPGTGAV